MQHENNYEQYFNIIFLQSYQLSDHVCLHMKCFSGKKNNSPKIWIMYSVWHGDSLRIMWQSKLISSVVTFDRKEQLYLGVLGSIFIKDVWCVPDDCIIPSIQKTDIWQIHTFNTHPHWNTFRIHDKILSNFPILNIKMPTPSKVSKFFTSFQNLIQLGFIMLQRLVCKLLCKPAFLKSLPLPSTLSNSVWLIFYLNLLQWQSTEQSDLQTPVNSILNLLKRMYCHCTQHIYLMKRNMICSFLSNRKGQYIMLLCPEKRG